MDRGYAAAVAVRGELNVTAPTISRLSVLDVVEYTTELSGLELPSGPDVVRKPHDALQTARTPP